MVLKLWINCDLFRKILRVLNLPVRIRPFVGVAASNQARRIIDLEIVIRRRVAAACIIDLSLHIPAKPKRKERYEQKRRPFRIRLRLHMATTLFESDKSTSQSSYALRSIDLREIHNT